jgi:hypothetical protein
VLLIRVAGLFVAIALAVCIAVWLTTGERKWLTFAWKLFRVALFVVVLFLVLLFGERLLAL